MIKLELEQKLEQLNGDNNSKLLPKDKKGEWEYKYVSTTRTVLRNLWLLDFFEILFQNLNENREETLGHIAKEAYNKGLAPHHPWIVRQGAKIGLLAVPHKETFMG